MREIKFKVGNVYQFEDNSSIRLLVLDIIEISDTDVVLSVGELNSQNSIEALRIELIPVDQEEKFKEITL